MITFEDCRRELLDRGGESALAAYQAWLDRPGYQPVHELVHGFKHDYLLRITHNELLDARARSEHALGDVRTEEQMAEVEDWTTPFAFQHLFHKYIEVERKVPTWQDFAAWLNREAAALFIRPLLEHVGWHTADEERRRKLKRAFRWRIGNFYLSSMR